MGRPDAVPAPDPAPTGPEAPIPEWLVRFRTNCRAGVAHMFALTLNVGDFVPHATDDEQYLTLRQFLRTHVFCGKRLVIFYDRSSGITFGGATPEETERMENEFRKLSGLTSHGDDLRRMNPMTAFDALDRVLTMPPEKIRELLGKGEDEFPKGAIVVIIGFAETIAPAGDIARMDPNDRTNIVTLARWARSKPIEERDYLIVLLTVNEADLAAHLRNAATDIVTIRVPLPAPAEREAFLAHTVRRRQLTLPDDTGSPALARATAGLSLRTIDDIIRLAVLQRHPLDIEWIWQHKKAAIERMCGGLLEIIRPVWTLDHVGGLAHVKRYLTQVVEAIRRGRVTSVPQGILFLGPPGTGKTIMAEAIANGLGFPMVRLRNIHEMWVGASERNQEFVFDLIEELAPVLVFEDEIDQQEQARGTAPQGDSGVSARLLARKLAFLSDTQHRGRVLWIAASNRPDLIDPAMLRPGRFDAKIPFLLPTATERPDILLALMRKLSKYAELSGSPIQWAITPEEIAEVAKTLDQFSGAEMELMLTRAVGFADRDGHEVIRIADVNRARADLIRTRSQQEYEHQTLLALHHCDSFELLPEVYHQQARHLQTEEGFARLLTLHRMFQRDQTADPFDPTKVAKA